MAPFALFPNDVATVKKIKYKNPKENEMKS